MDIVMSLRIRRVDQLEGGEEGGEVGATWWMRRLFLLGDVVLDWGAVSDCKCNSQSISCMYAPSYPDIVS